MGIFLDNILGVLISKDNLCLFPTPLTIGNIRYCEHASYGCLFADRWRKICGVHTFALC